MVTWFLNPKNMILTVLAALVVVIGGLYLWQRNTVVQQAGQIDSLKVANAGLTSQVANYKAGIIAAKKAQAEQQKVADNMAKLLLEAQAIETNCILGGNDEKTISNITYFFNSHGLLSAGDSASGGKVLSQTGEASIDRPRWTVRQIVQNYGVVIDYVMRLEKTVECYSGDYETGD